MTTAAFARGVFTTPVQSVQLGASTSGWDA
eukprot:SAG31_NODE_31888_length_362_cov_2.197719_1_plen_29_part_01